MARAIGTLGTVDLINMGGRTFTDLTNLIKLNGLVTNTTNGSGMRKTSGSAGYQVTTGKTLTMHACRLINNGTGASVSVVFAQTDNDIGFNQAVSGYTNPVYECGTNTMSHMAGTDRTNSTASNALEHELDMAVAALKYCSVGPSQGSVGNAAASVGYVRVLCYET